MDIYSTVIWRKNTYNNRSWSSSFKKSPLWGKRILPTVCLGRRAGSILSNFYINPQPVPSPSVSCPALPSADDLKGTIPGKWHLSSFFLKKWDPSTLLYCEPGELCIAGICTHPHRLALPHTRALALSLSLCLWLCSLSLSLNTRTLIHTPPQPPPSHTPRTLTTNTQDGERITLWDGF